MKLLRSRPAFRLAYHETAEMSRKYAGDTRLLKVFRRELAALQQALGPRFDVYWWKSYGLYFIAGEHYGAKNLPPITDHVMAWRDSIKAARSIIGKENRIEVNEYSGNGTFEAVWMLKGYDENPWWCPGLSSNIWPVSLPITIKQHLGTGDCDVEYVDVLEKRPRVSELCKGLATAIR